MEFGYHPAQVVMTLAAFGIRAERAEPPAPPPRLSFRTPRAAIGSALRWSQHHARRLLPRPAASEGWGFQILGVNEA